MATQRLPQTITPLRLPRASIGLRARRLARRRRRLADDLERLLIAAREAPAPLTAAIPVQRAQVRAARTLILELGSTIRSDTPVEPAGLILARRILTDGSGPAFTPSPPGALADAVEHAILALGDVRAQPS